MGVKKGQDNFSVWRKDRQKKNLAMVKEAILEAGKHKLTFSSEDKMASWVATRIGVHRTTVTRSIIYMQEIRDFVYKQAGVGSLEVSEDSGLDFLLSKIKTLQMEIVRKDRIAKRLESYIEKHNIPVVDEADVSNKIVRNKEYEKNISDLCNLILLVHERVSGIIHIDLLNNEVHDLSVRGKAKVVASGEQVKVLFDWLDNNKVIITKYS